MGAVYRARDLHFPKLVKLVAVKEMVNQARDPVVRKTIVQNFEREANLLATLHHPSIPRIFDYFTQGERSYLVMEFIKGKDLEELINEQKGFFPEELIVKWGVELCDVLNYLHTHEPDPIIFRDMKPSNVMHNEYDNLVLIDFGIAKPFETGQKGTQIGTEGYSPPEQYRGEASPKADIYALGATLHHLITLSDPRLEAPFSFSERPVSTINQNVSPELEAVINNALKYEPDERFKSAIEMKEALLSVARKTGILSTMSLSSKTTKIATDGSNIKPIWMFKCEDEIRGSPTYAHGNVYVGSYDHNLYALDAENGEFIWKYATESGVISKPLLIENNIFIGSEDHRLHAVSTRSGKVVWTYFTDGPVRSSPRIAEGHIFIGSDDGFLHAVNVMNARRAWRMEAGAPVRSTPFIKNDLVYFGCESGDFYCLDFSGGIKWRFRAKRAVTSSPFVADEAVYFSSLDWSLYALDAETGWVLWRFRTNKPSISSPVLAEDRVFVGSADHNIYCVDIHSGKEVWRFRTENQVTGSPLIYKDSLYCGSVDGNLYSLEHHTGRLRWKFQTEGPITGTPVAYEDVIYFGSTDKHIYALIA